jgi:imidazole glycerol-phosphate synthase subunit HisH
VKVAIVDYGMGNIRSIVSALKYIDIQDIVVSANEQELKGADKIILPGVGSFAAAMKLIKNKNLDSILNEIVMHQKKPVLGICLGMQLMSNSSSEDQETNGLGFIDATVRKFNIENLKTPHVGFNQVSISNDSRLYNGLPNLSDFYFTHSYQMQTDKNITQSTCDYGNEFVVSYEVDNIAGVQFHPELSQTNGLKLLDNFINNF